MKSLDIGLSLIVAVAENGVIGRNGTLPWRVKSDLRRFRLLTWDHPMIMGRKTFESIGRPLQGRDSIVLSKARPMIQEEGLYPAASLEDALATAEACAKNRKVRDAFVIGGAGVFDITLPIANRIYLTRIHATPDGDTFWTPPPDGDWKTVSSEHRAPGPDDEFDVTDFILERT